MERTEAQWVTNWLEKHPDRDEDSARSEWESLSFEIRMYLMTISDKEIRVTEEIRAKLLATLDEYPAPEALKEPFRRQCSLADSGKSW
jgi:hypothetical protein